MRVWIAAVLMIALVGCKHSQPPKLLTLDTSVTHTNASWWITTPKDSDTILRVDAPLRDLECFLDRGDSIGFTVTCRKIGGSK